jgi:peptide/nickel transport system permease protein
VSLATVDEPARRRASRAGFVRSPRLRAALSRIGWAVGTLLLISVVTFFSTSLKSPEELAKTSLGRFVTDEQIASFVERHDLDRPVLARYGHWLGNAAQGDFGTSVVNDRPVRAEIMPRLGRTLLLSLLALVIAIPVGIILGVWSARRWGTRADLSVNVIAVVVSAFPEFVIGLVLLMIFSVTLAWLPVDSGNQLAFGDFGNKLQAYVLPTATLVLASIPYMLRNTRVAAREALVAPYTRAAVLRGLPRHRVVWDHAMRNAATPIINAVAINLVYLLSGVIVVENLFGFPGLGQALVGAVGNGDTIMVQAIALLMGAMFISISVAADLIAVLFNPRLKAARG